MCSVLCVVLCSVLCCVLLGGRFWKSIWPLGGSFWPLGGSFWPLGASFWPLGGSFLASWKPLGASWIFWVILGPARWGAHPPLGGFWSPKRSQDEAKFRPKTDQNRCQKRSRRKKPLKIVLEGSWAGLGPILAPSWPVLDVTEWGFLWGKVHSMKINVFTQDKASRRVLCPSWVDLSRFGSPKGGQDERRGGPKSNA